MTAKIPLRDIAHARSGDKGNRSNLAIFAYEPEHYEALRRQLTPEEHDRMLSESLDEMKQLGPNGTN